MEDRRRRGRAAGDRTWHGRAHLAVGCALGFGGLTLLVDWDAGTLTPARALLWVTLAAAVLTMLLPAHVTAGPGWLAVRGPLRRRTVRTDSLVYVGQYGDVCAHLVLRDTHGSRLELDPGVLHANPLLWHELDTGVRRSLERGTLRRGAEVLARLGHEIDDTNARAVLDASGLG
ncbi:hypothetical protein AB0M11_11735 [Streptomyces sp. NPDC051987]|uniref:hypothetical protein n=1 Tax=Streptomyces sp. NPDC051987 TaxID=3155808 RepID=UPI0034495B61